MLGSIQKVSQLFANYLPATERSEQTTGYERMPAPLYSPAMKAPSFLAATPFTKALAVPFKFVDTQGAPTRYNAGVEFNAKANLFAAGPTSEDLIAMQRIVPSVVRVSAKDAKGSAWYGSGSIVDPSEVIPGYVPKQGEYFILTNQHVAEGATHITIKLANGQEYFAEVVRSPYGAQLLDAEMDIAILRVIMPYSIPMAKIGDSSQLIAGQPIFTAGHPRALPNLSITKGIISNPQQETGELSLDIQSDAPINPGNSGGPAFNLNGEVVGLNTYTFRDGEDLTFTKPINAQLTAVRQIYSYGAVVRGTLGFSVSPLPLLNRHEMGFPEEETGGIISGVEANSPAAKAGLKVGDIVTWMEVRQNGAAINFLDVDIHDYFEAAGSVRRWASKLIPGTKVNAIVYRKSPNGAYLPFEIEITTGMWSN